MRILESAVLENKSVVNFLENISGIKGHQGSTVRFSDKFLLLYELYKINPKLASRYIDVFIDNDLFFYERFWGQFSIYFEQDFLPRISGTDISDFADFRRKFPDLKPFELEVSIFNDASLKEFEGLSREYNDNKENNSFNVISRRKDRNMMLNGSRSYHETIKGGISIGNNRRKVGTLGGILKDRKSGAVYAMTCAHVIGSDAFAIQPSVIDSDNVREIGQVETFSHIIWTNQGLPCNTRSTGTIPNMDASLIRLHDDIFYEHSILNLGKVVGMRTLDEIDQNMKVEFNGRTTDGRNQLVIGGITVSYKVHYEDENHETRLACFTNLVEVRRPNPIMMGGHYYSKSPVRPGDSGAWVCSNDENGYKWCGMLISGDYDRGYFLPAEDINRWMNNQGYQMEYGINSYQLTDPILNIDVNLHQPSW
ncbi:MAG: hypothetical protein ACOYOO_08395 [Saprospiraceae bacterium]